MLPFLNRYVLHILSVVLIPVWVLCAFVYHIGGMVHAFLILSLFFYAMGRIRNS